MKNKLLFLALTLLSVSLLFSEGAFSQSTSVRVVPSSVPSPRVGDTFTVDIVIENGQNVAGYQVMLDFEYPAIEFLYVEHGDYLPANAFLGRSHFIGSDGTVFFAATASPQERSGNGRLATLTFKINEVKPATFRLIAGNPSKPTHGTILVNKNVQLSFPQLGSAEMFSGTDGPYLTLPSDVISEVAFGPNSTYFILTGQFPELKGVNNPNEVIYEKSITTIDIPNDPRLYFWAPMEKKTKSGYFGLGPDIAVELATSQAACELVKIIPKGGRVLSFIACGQSSQRIDALYQIVKSEADKIEKPFDDPVIELKNKKNEPGLPSDSKYKIFVAIPRQVEKIKIEMGLEYRLNGKKDGAIVKETLVLKDIAAAAPSVRPISLADYPPFQMLSPEVQEYLIQHFGEFPNARAWQAPEQTSLLANYPNPFNPETWIPYQLAQPSDVTVRIYDMQGHLVRELALGHQRAGVYRDRSRAAYWDGRNTHGEPVASGVYFYTLTAGDFSATRKMLIRK